MKTFKLSGENAHDTINIPDRLVNHQVYFWQNQDYIDTFALNPEMSIVEFTEALPIDNCAERNVQSLLLLSHFNKLGEEVAMDEMGILWNMYEQDFEDQKQSRAQITSENGVSPPLVDGSSRGPKLKFSMER